MKRNQERAPREIIAGNTPFYNERNLNKKKWMAIYVAKVYYQEMEAARYPGSNCGAESTESLLPDKIQVKAKNQKNFECLQRIADVTNIANHPCIHRCVRVVQ